MEMAYPGVGDPRHAGVDHAKGENQIFLNLSLQTQ